MRTTRLACLLSHSFIVAAMLLIGATAAFAQIPKIGHTTFAVGALQFIETPRMLSVFHEGVLLGTTHLHPGDVFDPPIHVSDTGVLTLGQVQFDSRRGVPVKVKPATACERHLASEARTWLRSNAGQAMVLKPLTNADQKTVAYRSRLIDLGRCTVVAQSIIQGEDVDQFFEFEGSTSGWWLVGPDEGFVLISRSGRVWQKLHLPEGISNVLTARWRDDGSFWILANRLHGSELTPTLYQSLNLGNSWRSLEASGANLPPYWLAAARELSASRP